MQKNKLCICSFLSVIIFALPVIGYTCGDDSNSCLAPAELRIGAFRHDVKSGLKHHYEKGYDVNAEYLMRAFRGKGRKTLFSPRLHFGTHINTKKGSHQFYTGLTWRYDINQLFAEASFGASANTAKRKKKTAHKTAVGSPVMFRESFAVGMQLTPKYSVSVMIDHTSNAGLVSPNPGITNVGVRLGCKF